MTPRYLVNIVLLMGLLRLTEAFVVVTNDMWGCLDNMPACKKNYAKTCVRDQYGNRGCHQQIVEAPDMDNGFSWRADIGGYTTVNHCNHDGNVKIAVFRPGVSDQWEDGAMGPVTPFGAVLWRGDVKDEIKELCACAKQHGSNIDSNNIVNTYKGTRNKGYC